MGLAICTVPLIPLFLHDSFCDPYADLIRQTMPPAVPPAVDPSMTDNPFSLNDGCGDPGPFASIPALFGGAIAVIGMYLAARFSNRAPERAALGVGIAGTVLAALLGFAKSGLDPALVLTDPDFYFALPVTIAFAIIAGKLERRRRGTPSLYQREQQ